MRCHLVARSIWPLEPLASFEPSAWLWASLRRAFPTALDCVLMPNGLHLVDETADPEVGRAKLSARLRGFTRRYGRGRRLWEPVPPATEVPDRLHQRRTSRYLALNPSRAELVVDPLQWLWSTYRDVMGASAEPWVTAGRLASALRLPRADFERSHHEYVSSDPTVAVAGTPAPQPAPPTRVACFPLQRIQLAAAAAYRQPPARVFRHPRPRRLFVVLARDQGWPVNLVALACGLTPQAVRKVVVAPQVLAAGRLCLGDDRLLAPVRALEVSPEETSDASAALELEKFLHPVRFGR